MTGRSAAAAGGNAPSVDARKRGFHARFTAQNASGRAMNAPLSRFARLFMMALLLALSVVQPAAAQQAAAQDEPQILRDTETEHFFSDRSKPLIEAAGLDPHSAKVVLLGDPEINAFVATGQTVY